MSCDNVGFTQGNYKSNGAAQRNQKGSGQRMYETEIIVQSGETPDSLAQLFGVSRNDIIAQNRNKWNGKWFKVGDKLKILSKSGLDEKKLAERAQSRKEAESVWLNRKNGAKEAKPKQNQGSSAPAQTSTSTPQKSAKRTVQKGNPANKGRSNQRSLESVLKDPDIKQAVSKTQKMNLFSPEHSKTSPKAAGLSGEPSKTFDRFAAAKEKLGLGIDRKKTARNKNAAGDIIYHKDGSVTLSDRVEKRILQMSQTLNCDSTDLKGLFFAESNFELNGKGAAAGINQLTGTGVKGYNNKYGTNLSKPKVRNMDVMQQLDVAENSLKLAKELGGFKNGEQITGGQLFALNMYPTKAKNYKVISKSEAPTAYNANRRLDFDKDGFITIDEYNKEILNKAQYVRSENA